jgi:dipeptidase E
VTSEGRDNMLAHEAWLEGFVGRGGSYPSSGGSSMKMYLSSYELGNGVEKLKGLLPSNRKAGCIFNALDKFPAEKQRRVEADIAALIEVGLQAELLDLQMYFNKEAQLREKINQFGALWVSGGNVFVLRQAMKLSGLDSILHELNNKDDFLYGAYSAGVCVLSPSLDGYHIVDDATATPYPELQQVLWEGVGIIDFTFLPHYKSAHSEAAAIEKELEYCKERGIPYRTLSDGEVIIIE